MTLLALFASVGLNLYLGWIAWDTYNRYQDLVADMRTTGPRRERRRERRRFTEPAASSAATIRSLPVPAAEVVRLQGFWRAEILDEFRYICCRRFHPPPRMRGQQSRD